MPEPCAAWGVNFNVTLDPESASNGRRYIPFLSLRDEIEPMAMQLEQAASRVIRSGQYLFGQEVEAFEQQWAGVLGRQGAVGCANGLDALSLSLRALEIGPGDEVIVPDMTFVATALAVIHCGAVPVIVDVDSTTLLMDPARIEEAISPRTRAVIPVHLYGQMADVESIAALVGDEIAIIEDAAQAHLATRWGGSPGKHSALSCYSFYPGKNLGALGDGGAIVSDRLELLSKVRELGNYGQRNKYDHRSIGLNSRLDEIQAAFLQVRLKHLLVQTHRRRQIASRYGSALENHAKIELLTIDSGNEAVWHVYPIRVAHPQKLARTLDEFGIGTQHHYSNSLSNITAIRNKIKISGNTSVARAAAARLISLPIGASILDQQVDWVIEVLLREIEKCS